METQIMAANAIVADVNAILSKHGISEAMKLQDITVTDKTVTDMAKPCPRLGTDPVAGHQPGEQGPVEAAGMPEIDIFRGGRLLELGAFETGGILA